MFAAAAVLAGCGSSKPRTPPKEQVAHVRWREAGRPPGLEGKLVVSVETIRIGPGGWTVRGSVSNETRTPLSILPRAHSPGRTGFGVIVTTRGSSLDELPPGAAPALATRIRPATPVVLQPGEAWNGSFSGPHRIDAGTIAHAVFGDLGTPTAHRFQFITDHGYRVK